MCCSSPSPWGSAPKIIGALARRPRSQGCTVTHALVVVTTKSASPSADARRRRATRKPSTPSEKSASAPPDAPPAHPGAA